MAALGSKVCNLHVVNCNDGNIMQRQVERLKLHVAARKLSGDGCTAGAIAGIPTDFVSTHMQPYTLNSPSERLKVQGPALVKLACWSHADTAYATAINATTKVRLGHTVITSRFMLTCCHAVMAALACCDKRTL